MSDPTSTPDPHSIPGGLDSEQDLVTGADDAPDIVQGVAEDEPDLSTIELKDTPFRTPEAGAHLTDDELEQDLADE